MRFPTTPIHAVVIGLSAGGTEALRTFLPVLPKDFFAPITVVLHIADGSDDDLPRHLDSRCAISVKEAQDGEPVRPGQCYLAPAGYHLLIEAAPHRRIGTRNADPEAPACPEELFALSVDPPVRYSRPSIDVLFDSAAKAYGPTLVALVLTGANADGSLGLKTITTYGGFSIIQDPISAFSSAMPRAALAAAPVHQTLSLEQIGPYLCTLDARHRGKHSGLYYEGAGP